MNPCRMCIASALSTAEMVSDWSVSLKRLFRTGSTPGKQFSGISSGDPFVGSTLVVSLGSHLDGRNPHHTSPRSRGLAFQYAHSLPSTGSPRSLGAFRAALCLVA